MITIDLPPDTEKHFDELARKAGKSMESCARDAILDYLQDLEDLFDAQAQMEEVKAGRSQTIPLEEVMRHYGMEH